MIEKLDGLIDKFVMADKINEIVEAINSMKISLILSASKYNSQIRGADEYIDPIFDCVHDPSPLVHSDDSMPGDGSVLRDLFKK
jgi:hypothetical protein